jgi:hypothetical protein
MGRRCTPPGAGGLLGTVVRAVAGVFAAIFAGVFTGVIALSGCAGVGPGASIGAPAESHPDPTPRVGAPLILIAMPSSTNFQDVRRSLVVEIKRDFNVATFIVTPSTAMDDLAAVIKRTAPTCIVLMNNATVSLYREYQHVHRNDGPAPPSVVVMASFIDELRPTLMNATGIAYEVPGVMAFVDLRSVIKAPIRRVGVVYRPNFRQFIYRQKDLAEREQIDLVPVEVGKGVYADRLRSTLHALLVEQRVDALWMLNDNELIKSDEYLDQTWRAELRNVNVPLVVGVPNLVTPRMPLGSFAVVPDHEALGLQTANLIFDLAENGWRAEDHDVELPLSVKTLADVKQLRDRFGLKDDALQHIDRAME